MVISVSANNTNVTVRSVRIKLVMRNANTVLKPWRRHEELYQRQESLQQYQYQMRKPYLNLGYIRPKSYQ